jgi:UDP-2,4-diacetamido-2,4,6-trideoxy-beta-L-altropyranose hydrolase
MNVIIRVDASIKIGIGHTMRCLTLADELFSAGWTVYFITRAHPGNINFTLKEKGYEVFDLAINSLDINVDEQSTPYLNWLGASWTNDAAQVNAIVKDINPELLIVDHYALDIKWEQNVKHTTSTKMIVIDDLANRKHDCDALIDQTLGRNEVDYNHLVPKECLLLLGADYAMLRRDFTDWRKHSLDRRGSYQFAKLLITLGGVDKDNFTYQVLKVIETCTLPEKLEITVIMGATAPHREAVKSLAKNLPYKTEVLSAVKNMAEYMAESDLAIGAAGSTSWERCCLGLPTYMIVIADNQKEIAQSLDLSQAAKLIDLSITNNLAEALESIDDFTLKRMSSSAINIIDGHGTQRVLDRILAL